MLASITRSLMATKRQINKRARLYEQLDIIDDERLEVKCDCEPGACTSSCSYWLSTRELDFREAGLRKRLSLLQDESAPRVYTYLNSSKTEGLHQWKSTRPAPSKEPVGAFAVYHYLCAEEIGCPARRMQVFSTPADSTMMYDGRHDHPPPKPQLPAFVVPTEEEWALRQRMMACGRGKYWRAAIRLGMDSAEAYDSADDTLLERLEAEYDRVKG